jgi:NhaP-type Na+/H+ or K+/H+ antiporter
VNTLFLPKNSNPLSGKTSKISIFHFSISIIDKMGFQDFSSAKMSASTQGIYTVAVVLCFMLLVDSAFGNSEVEEFGTLEAHASEHGEGGDPAHAVLYPPFVLSLGVVVYYVLSRYLHWLPYTAVMFIFGVIMGISSVAERAFNPDRPKNYMQDTLFAWQDINSEVLLLIFLPGLLFKDALSQNTYLFAIGFGQLFMFAFPLVLAGTALTALVAYYIFPFEWSFSLCLTFGSILSATDPVAVAALLEEVGAPPRLKTHIAGESLLNDGAAIVFFFIFSEIFFSEFDIEGFGEKIGWGEGVKIFVQKAFGGAAIGLVAGAIIIFVMVMLHRRFSREENIVQVTAVVGLVYLNYFVADLICGTSGVIATLVAGLCVKFFGRSVINDIHLMDDFFTVLEHILNTVLFCLGGLVWGRVVFDNHLEGIWTGKDWGYLFLLYLLLHVIRAVLFVAVYPLTARIGLKTNWQETVFQIYGGLRGAVGIALAIALDNETDGKMGTTGIDGSEKHIDVSQLYSMVGGIAFLTLVINGSTAGPLLKKLGLADSTEEREKIIEAYRAHLRSEQIDFCAKLLTSPRFKNIDFEFVLDHIPCLKDLTLDQLSDAVEKLKATTTSDNYSPPYLENVLLVLEKGSRGTRPEILNESPEAYARMKRMEKRKRGRLSTARSSMVLMMKGDPLSTKELRLLFISMLRSQYENLIDEGMLTSQHFLTIALDQSLKLAESEVNEGGPLNDLYHLRNFHKMAVRVAKIGGKAKMCCRFKKVANADNLDLHAFVLQEMSFADAHERAQQFFQEQLGDSDSDLSEAGKIVLAESNRQLKMINADLNNEKTQKFVREVATHKFCDILVNRSIQYIERLVKFGLLKESEAEEIVDEMIHIQKNICEAKINMHVHASEYDFSCRDLGPASAEYGKSTEMEGKEMERIYEEAEAPDEPSQNPEAQEAPKDDVL